MARDGADWHRRVWRLAYPVVLSNLSTPLVGTVDAAVVGHLDDPRYLAGVALGALVITSIFWVFGFLRMGTTGLAAQTIGAGDPDETKRVLLRALVIAAALGLLIILLQAPVERIALALFDAPAEVEDQALLYVRLRIWSAPAALANYAILGWLLGVQRPKTALAAQIILNITNIALSLLFVVELEWAVPGVAAAALASEIAALVAGLVLIVRSSGGLSRWLLPPSGDLAGFRRLAAVNINIFLRSLCLTAGFALFTQRGSGYGEVILAANALLLNIQTIIAFGLDGFANAAEALVGAATGAGDRRSFAAAVRASSIWALVTALIMAGAIGLFGHQFIWLLTDLPNVREAALEYLPWAAVMPLVAVWSFQLDGIFIGATRAAAMRDAMIMSLAIFAAAAFLLPPAFGNHGLWAAMVIFMIARALTLGAYYPAMLNSVGASVR